MRPEQRDAALLWDMYTAAEAIGRFIEGKSFDDYLREPMLRAAVERQVEIIGEAARSVSKGLKDEHPEIPWHKIVGQRHVLAHEYGAVVHERLWRVAVTHVPELVQQLERLVPFPPDDPAP